MRTSQLKQWLERIYKTQEIEISCSDCFDLISTYVDLELAGKDAETRLPFVKQHLFQCQVCQEEYEIIRELAGMSAD